MIATLIGGPTTLPGTGISAMTFGGVTPRSMMVTVSGAALGTTLTTPLSSTTLLSFDETAHWAGAPGGSASPIRSEQQERGPERTASCHGYLP